MIIHGKLKDNFKNTDNSKKYWIFSNSLEFSWIKSYFCSFFGNARQSSDIAQKIPYEILRFIEIVSWQRDQIPLDMEVDFKLNI